MVCCRPHVVGMLPSFYLLGFGIVCHSCNYLVTHIDMFLVHYRIVSFPVTACQHPEMDAEYAPAEAERRVVFHRCHRVKWLSENDHLKYPDNEPNSGLAFLFIRNLFTSRCALPQENVQYLHKRHLRIGVNWHYRSFEVDFHLVYVYML